MVTRSCRPLTSLFDSVCMCTYRWLACFIAFAPCIGLGSPIAHPPLTDSRAGMTCGSHFAAVGAEWMRRGGDWSDAKGTPYGEVPFASASIRPTSTRQLIEWDVTALAREWASGKEPVGALFLRSLSRPNSGVVNFASRENPDEAAHPSLVIEWDNGERSSLTAAADTSINCTTIRSLGAGSTVSVGGSDASALVFPFKSDGKRQVRSAKLVLTSDKQWGRGADVGVYRLVPPWVLPSATRTGLAASYPGDKNIASHPAVYFATGFEKSAWQSEWSTYGTWSVTEIVSGGEANGFEPLQGRALRVTLVPRQNLGLDVRYDFAKLQGAEPEEAYFRYYLRFGDDWNPTLDGGKLPGFAGTYNRGGWGLRKSNGLNGWSTRGSFFAVRPDSSEMKGFAGIGSYVYHADIENAHSVSWGWGMGPTGRLRKNQWYSIEQYVKMNDPGKSNGVLRAWIDGHLVFERSNLRYRDIPDLKIENAWFNVYHGGVAKPPHEMSLYIDNVVIAREYIGPMPGGEK